MLRSIFIDKLTAHLEIILKIDCDVLIFEIKRKFNENVSFDEMPKHRTLHPINKLVANFGIMQLTYHLAQMH